MGMLYRIYLLSTKSPKPFDLMALLLDPVYDALELVEIGKFNHDPALALRVGGELHDGTERFGERLLESNVVAGLDHELLTNKSSV